ncbi:MAG: hydroxymethylglutaryl-CoA lyase [Kordiimonadaceae bacterium]|nr:hydroxymethylglutaryl-CoA lyase [Kordiimonadaceae bacterium]
MTTNIEIVEVSARDGLQSEKKFVATLDKLALIKRAIDAGLRRIEVTSFVNPKRVPQMADAEELVQMLPECNDVRYTGLVLNYRGFERARALQLDEIGCAFVATDSFNKRSQGLEVAEAINQWNRIADDAHTANIKTQIIIGAAFGCPFEGEVSTEHVVNIAKQVAKAGPSEIGLADTIGVAVPLQITEVINAVKNEVPDIKLRCHLHNSRNTGFANAIAAIDAGVEVLDASIGGIGGCPFAPHASGNISTDDLVYMLERSGIKTGVDLTKIIETSLWLETILKKPMSSQVAKSGIFPPIETN